MKDILKYIDTLPQASVISHDARVDWINKVSMLEDNHNIMWHVRRLRGIGSSEIGCCVSSHGRDEYTAFQDATDVVLSKLMLQAPDNGSGDTRRGNAMEDMIRQMFHKKYGTSSEESIMNDMGAVVVPGHEWMVGNPDDICLIDGGLYMVDYKCPMPENLEKLRKEGGVKFDYVCQLHHLQRIAEELGVVFKGKLLCSLDIKGWDLDVRLVEHDSDLLEEMISVGDDLWNNHVMQGKIPERIYQPKFENISEEEKKRLDCLARDFVILRTAGSIAYQISGELADEMSALSQEYRIQDAKIPLIGGSIKASYVMDTEVLKAIAERNGIAVPGNLEDGDAVDLLITEFEQHGIDQELYIKEKHAFTMSRAKKGADFDFIADCKIQAKKTLENHVAKIVKDNERVEGIPNQPVALKS